MVAVNTLVQDIVADIPEIPTFIAVRQYLRALRELCEKARVWRVDDAISTVLDTPTRDLSSLMPSDTELVDVISIKPSGGGETLKPRTQAWLDTNITNWRADMALVATNYVLQSNNVIRLYPTPSDSVADAYYIRMAVKPLLTATIVDDLVINKFSELLISGAKAYLYMTPRKPWTDLQLAQFHLAMFSEGIPAAKLEAAEEFQTGVPRKVKYGGV